MKFALHTSTAISSVLKEPEHFYVDIYYLIILIIVAFTLLLLSFLRYHLYKTKKEKELREIASLVDKNEILIQRYSREMSHIKEQLEAKEKCLKEYQHAAQWKAHRDVESLIKEKERLAKCLLEQLDTFKKLKILSKSETILPDSDWRNLIEIVNLIKYKIKTGDAPSYRLTVDQLAKLFNLNFEENKERKRNVTKVLKGINEHLRFTNFQFKYVKGANDKWAYTVDFEFSQETLDYFDERYTAMFTQRFYSDLLWRYAGLAFPNCAVGRDRVNKVEDIKSDRNLYEDYLAWANSPQNKALKEEVYRENFFRVFGKTPEEFGLTSNAPTVTREPKEFIVKNPPTVTPEPEKII